MFGRKKPAHEAEAAAPAPAKRGRNSVRCGELNAAIGAACAATDDCTGRKTLEALNDLTDNIVDDDALVKLDGEAPVSVAQLDEALAEVVLPAGTLGPLKRVRALLAHAEAQKAKEPVQYLTIAQAKTRDAALFDAFGWALGAMAEELNRMQPSQAHVLDLLGRSASTPERKKLLSSICEFREAHVPPRTQAEWLRYQSTGKWQ